MPEKVTIREDLQIIHVDSYDDVSLEDLKGSLQTVLTLSQARGITRVLVDATRESSLPDTLPMFEFGSDLARIVGGLKFAVVRPPALKEDLNFLESVTRNRGAMVRIFSTEAEALGWLLSDLDETGRKQGG